MALVDQRVFEEFIERIGGLRAEPRVEARASALRAEDAH